MNTATDRITRPLCIISKTFPLANNRDISRNTSTLINAIVAVLSRDFFILISKREVKSMYESIELTLTSEFTILFFCCCYSFWH